MCISHEYSMFLIIGKKKMCKRTEGGPALGQRKFKGYQPPPWLHAWQSKTVRITSLLWIWTVGGMVVANIYT